MANTQTSTTTLPSWVQKPTQDAIGDISSWLKSPSNYVYGSKPGESLYTPLSNSQNEAIGNANWMADQDLASLLGINKAGSMWDRYANAKPNLLTQGYRNTTAQGLTGGGVAGQINKSLYGKDANDLSGERIVDESGFLGGIDDYMNPYLQQVLDPQIRELEEGRQRAVRDQGAAQTMAGAFGDARHGIMDSEIFGKTQEAISDATGRTMATGFDTAMNLRRGDMGAEDQRQESAINRLLGIDTANIGYKENALTRGLQAALAKAGYADADANRLLTRDTLNQTARDKATERLGVGAKAHTDLGQTYLKNFMDVNDSLFNAGEVERDAQEEQRVSVQDFQTAIKDKRFNDALRMLGALQGTQQPTTTQSTQSSNDGIWGVLGSVLGGLL